MSKNKEAKGPLKTRRLTYTETMEQLHLKMVRRLCERVGPGNGISLPPQGEGKDDE